MPLTFPSATSDPPRTAYTDTPWEDGNGQKWKWQQAALRWIPVIEATGGASTFAELTDKATADLPAINGPLSDALDLKANGDHSHTLLDSATPNATADTLVLRDVDGSASFGSSVDKVTIGETHITHDHLPSVGNTYAAILDLSSNLSGTRLWKTPDASGTLALTASTTGEPDSLSFGTGNDAVSLSASAMTFGSTAKGAMLDALGASAGGKTILTGATVDQAAAVTSVTRKITTGDVSRSSANTGTTYTDDATLAGFALDANSWYLVEFALIFTCTTNGGIKLQLTHAQQSTQNGNIGRYFTPGAAGDISVSSQTVTPILAVTSARSVAPVTGFCRLRIGASGGTLTLQWAQNAGPHADNTTLHAGSLITVTKL